MSEKGLRCSRIIENMRPQDLTDKLLNRCCESVADAFLGQIEYGKDYVLNTKLAKEDWADGFGTKYTYTLTFDELVRCRDCMWFANDAMHGAWCKNFGVSLHDDYDGFCKWGERKEGDSRG